MGKRIVACVLFVLLLAMAMPVLATSDNLLTANPGFESNSLSWAISAAFTGAGATYEVVQDPVHGGQNSLKTVHVGGETRYNINYNKTVGDGIELRTDYMYEYSVWVNIPTPLTGGAVFLTYRGYKANGEGNDYAYSASLTDTGGAWEKLSVRFVPAYTSLQYLYISFDEGISGVVYFDDASLIELGTDTVGFYTENASGETIEMKEMVYGQSFRATAFSTKEAVLYACQYMVRDDVWELVKVEMQKGKGFLAQEEGFFLEMEGETRAVCAYLFESGTAKPLCAPVKITEWQEKSRENLLINGDFELLSGTSASGWGYSNGGGISVSQEGKDNTNCIELNLSSGNTYITRNVEGIIGGSRYALEFDYTTGKAYSGEGARIKLEYYSADGSNFDSVQTGILPIAYGTWVHNSFTFTPPPETVKVRIYLRLFGGGTIKYDNVGIYLEEITPVLSLEGDTFFYTELVTGAIEVSVNRNVYVPSVLDAITVSLRDGESVLEEVEFTDATKVHTFTFPLSLLETTGKKYTVIAALRKESGVTFAGTEKEIYRYPRPSMIQADGSIEIDGEPFVPVMGYHVYEADSRIKDAKAAGVNVAVSGGENLARAKLYLDNCLANGIMGTLLLYSGMRPAGSAENLDNTIAMVEEFRDHDALFGYMVMDEPYVHSTDPEADLIRSYKTIRDLDSEHPVILQDSMMGNHILDCVKMCDIYVIHSYPMHKEQIGTRGIGATTEYVLDVVENALAPANTCIGERPVYCLTQTFGADERETATTYYMPTKDEVRNQLYQCVLHPACKGTGFYSFKEGTEELTNKPLYTGMKEIAATELEFIKSLQQKAYTVLDETVTKDSRWYVVRVDSKRYLIVLNMREAAAEIPVDTSESFTGTPYGESSTKINLSVGRNTTVSVPAHGVEIFKEA